ncbi:PREDICTED: uncharacterized protein LOC106120070 [Papilio xuthus]|uniref:Uncharacterized protein LOC106120070 n=1 Tax=Papilio xuthus TaxID=66420 RepID=A0AAJ6ZEB1_PAPXU|nr:PREDICTED: uncharacterized protein LOC106120070 [Papilio xuthus]
MLTWDQLLRGEWWVYMIIVIVIYLSILLLNYAFMKYNDAKLEERIRRLAEKDADTIQATYEARLEEAVRVRHEIQLGRPFIVVDEMDKPLILRTLYPDMRDFNHSTRSNNHPLTPLNKKLHVSITPAKIDNDAHRQCKGVITPIQTFKDMQIEVEVKQCLSDLLKKIKD